MSTHNLTENQRQWAERWIAGLRDGSYATSASFVRKLLPLANFTNDEATALLALADSPSVPASTIASVVNDAVLNGMSLHEARQAHGVGDA